MSFKGMDPQELQSFAARLDATANLLQNAHGHLGSRLRGVAWHGAVAERFTSDWFGAYQRQVTDACHQLTDLARRLRAEANAQDTASGAGGLNGIVGGTGRFGFGAPGALIPRGPIINPGVHLPPGFLPGLAAGIAGSASLVLKESLYPGIGIKRPTMEQRLETFARSAALSAATGGDREISASVTKEGHTTVGGVPVQGTASAKAYAEAHAGASGSISAKGVDASVVAGASVGATAGVVGLVGSRNLGVSGGASVSAQASAKAEAGAHIGRDGATAKAGGSIGASVSADAHVTAHTGGVDSTLGAHAYAGVQAHAQAEASATLHDVKAHVSMGAALGVGAGIDVTVEAHPDQVWKNMQKIQLPRYHF